MSKDTTLISSIKSFLTNFNIIEDEKEEEPVKNETDAISQSNNSEETEEQYQEMAIGAIYDNISDAQQVFNSQYLGVITSNYDESKDENDKLKTSNVGKVLSYQEAGIGQMIEAKNGNLTRRQY